MASIPFGKPRMSAWERRHFLKKHTGMHHAMLIAVPVSLTIWVLIGEIVGII